MGLPSSSSAFTQGNYIVGFVVGLVAKEVRKIVRGQQAVERFANHVANVIVTLRFIANAQCRCPKDTRNLFAVLRVERDNIDKGEVGFGWPFAVWIGAFASALRIGRALYRGWSRKTCDREQRRRFRAPGRQVDVGARVGVGRISTHNWFNRSLQSAIGASR